MKALLSLIILFFFSVSVLAQDLDIYAKKKNSNYELPFLNPQTSFEEFQILNRTLRMQDMVYAAIVPGYIHFKVKDPTLGYALLGARTSGYLGLYYVLTDNSYSLVELINNNPPNSANSADFNTQKNITYTALGLIIGSYLFDWIHGRHRLEKKQELIRYKYGMKLSLGFKPTQGFKQQAIPTIGLRYSF
ncbi:MAG: hypothetical protein JW857_08275 [Bacteroidales bacterium]|nr:hypothetical protein [Bacteroidales bacterium]